MTVARDLGRPKQKLDKLKERIDKVIELLELKDIRNIDALHRASTNSVGCTLVQ